MHKYLFAPLFAAAGFLLAFSAAPVQVQAQDVTITPLGTHDGQFCRRDRAMIFEDPNGTRVLIDAGRSVLGADDPRLGNIDIVLLTSSHSDHLGDRHPSVINNGACGGPTLDVSDTPHSNTAEIAAAKNSHVFVGGELSAFLNSKFVDIGTGGHAHTLRHGGSFVQGGVRVAIVTANHSNGINPAFLKGKGQLKVNGLTAYAGPENGYVLTFTNGLVIYITGDTGHNSDMALIVRDFYKPKVAIVTMGDGFTMGPIEGAFAVTNLLGMDGEEGSGTVIIEHANESSAPNALGPKATAFIAELGSNGYAVDDDLIGADNVIVPFSAVGDDFVITCTAAGVCTQSQP